MATAKKLPSGSWRCQVYSHTEEILQKDGTIKKKRIYRSFTCQIQGPAGKRKCEQMAASWAADKELSSGCSVSFGAALEEYIHSRENVLSPRTIMDYKCTRKNYIQSLMSIPIDRITQEDIQRAINLEAVHLSPKTIRNIHGLISAVLKAYRPEFALNTSLPKKKKVEMYIPSDEDVKKLISAAEGTDMELPILLAAFGPMRRGEICALRAEDINGSWVHVHRNMVCTEEGTWVEKSPKSYAGDRRIKFPAFVADKLAGRSGRIVSITPDQITNRFPHVLRDAGLPHFRFHDLRHYSASVQHAIGIPDAYIMQRGGWGNDGVLKSVYRHAMEDREAKMDRLANEHFEELCNTKCNTKEKSP